MRLSRRTTGGGGGEKKKKGEEDGMEIDGEGWEVRERVEGGGG